MPRPQRQHYISKFLIKRWADENGRVGVVCTYHRHSTAVRAERLHWVRSLSSPEQERTWNDEIENPAKLVLDGLVESLGPHMADHKTARAFLCEQGHLGLLIDLARLHHSRSLAVPTQQFVRSQGTPDSAAAEAMIRDRWEGTQDYHDIGVVLTVLPEGSPYALGAVPVFDTGTWGPRESVNARYMMPLTPRMMIIGAPGKPPRKVEIVPEDIGHDRLLPMPMAGEPGLFANPWMICEPSALEQTTKAVLDLSQGGGWHWLALRDRMTLCDDASREQQTDWEQRCDVYENNQLARKTGALRESIAARIHDTMTSDAVKIQADLDTLNAQVCGCSGHRNRKHGALWQRFMPQTICDEIRDQQHG